MAAEISRSAGPSASAADSYVGSLISLTSKCEIRYEGVLYNINTEESSIGLKNVRSFGTEGRKKDGPQIPASDKIYEYILFRGSDIKDLQVKSSPPPQAAPAPIHNDPAIIQSHYSRPPPSTSLPSVGSGTVADLSSHTAQMGPPRSPFQGNVPLYQPGGSLGSWGSSPGAPTVNGSGIAMPNPLPMYWQGYYAPTGTLPHLQQPPLLRPPPGMSLPHSMQQPSQFPGMTSASQNLQEFPPPLLPPLSSSLMSTSAGTFSSILVPSQASSLGSDASPIQIPTKPPTSLPAATIGLNLSYVPPLSYNLESIASLSQNVPASISSKPRLAPTPNMSYSTIPQLAPSVDGFSTSSQVETSVPLVTPGQFVQPPVSAFSPSQPLQTSPKDVEVEVQETKTKPLLPEPPVLATPETKEPILPLPTLNHQKPNGAVFYNHQSNRGCGRGRGRGRGYPRPVTKFNEDFDFIAMNEKFNKDEVWGHLGKNKAQLREGDDDEEADYTLDEYSDESSKLDAKPVYVKDDFFDTISCNTLDRGGRNGGRTRFSEQLKIDTELFLGGCRPLAIFLGTVAVGAADVGFVEVGLGVRTMAEATGTAAGGAKDNPARTGHFDICMFSHRMSCFSLCVRTGWLIGASGWISTHFFT
ncbi:protein decapping 5-like [Iris pallida]|uniref:Protein decapping 5-like n=1 Tax=Iris pallida TaxID=29817 RepID=A0AAX6GD87_IRIPA|nr:protein decapping 5-like [Iris pallida]